MSSTRQSRYRQILRCKIAASLPNPLLLSPNFPARQPPWRIVFILSVAWLAVAMQGSFYVFGGVDFLALCGYRTRFVGTLSLCCRMIENSGKAAFFACVYRLFAVLPLKLRDMRGKRESKRFLPVLCVRISIIRAFPFQKKPFSKSNFPLIKCYRSTGQQLTSLPFLSGSGSEA